jgi:hypothetical protein
MPRREHRVGRPAERRADHDLPFAEAAHQVRGELDAVGGQAGAVLDAVDAGLDGLLDRGRAWAWAVTGRPEAVRLLDHAAQLVEGELTCRDVGAGGHVPAAGHDLDDVDATFGPLPTAARSAFSPATSPPIFQQCPATEVMGGPDATMWGPGRGGTVAALDDGPVVVAQIPDRRHAEASCWASAVSMTACSWSP